MDESQRAMVAANIANLPEGAKHGNKHASKEVAEENNSANLPSCFSVAQAADAVNVGVRSVALTDDIEAN